jgi:hypothetical protein
MFQENSNQYTFCMFLFVHLLDVCIIAQSGRIVKHILQLSAKNVPSGGALPDYGGFGVKGGKKLL